MVFSSRHALGVDFPDPRWSKRMIYTAVACSEQGNGVVRCGRCTLYFSGLKKVRSAALAPPPGPPVYLTEIAVDEQGSLDLITVEEDN